MKTKFQILLPLLLILPCLTLQAKTVHFKREAKCAVFMLNGGVRIDIINYMSTGVNKIGFENSSKIGLFDIWMINFDNNLWNFPKERRELSNSLDTIFLRNGGVIKDKVRSYSTRRRVFYLRDKREIYVAKVKRIYFCCNKFPSYYREASKKDKTFDSKGVNKFYFRDGQVLKGSLAWTRGTGDYFMMRNGRKVYFRQLRRVVFAKVRVNKSKRRGTGFVILKNGKLINHTPYAFNHSSKILKFHNRRSIHIDKVAIINFGFHRPGIRPDKRPAIRRVE